jgi:surface protein
MFLGLGNTVPGLKGQFGVSADFSYPVTSWCKDDGSKTPTISGTEGGVFTFTPTDGSSNVLVWENPASPSTTSDDGIINTTSSPAGSYEITYTVEGLSNSVEITITADVSTTFTYPNGENRFTIFPTKADPSISGDFAITTNPGNLSINTTTGAIDLSTATAGQVYTVTFTPTGTPCGNPTTASFTVVQAFQSFEFTIQVSAGDTFTIPTTGSGYSYKVNWGQSTNNYTTNFVGQGNTPIGANYTGSATSPAYSTSGTYTIQIGLTGDTFPRIYFNNSGDKAKMRNVTSWGEILWTSFDKAFYGCTDLGLTATNSPNLSNCSSLMSAFESTTNFAGASSMNNWDISNVTTLSKCFKSSSSFNTDISNWNTSSVTSMSEMFRSASSFNQPINTNYLTDAQSPTGTAYTAWDVSSNGSFAHFLDGASSFNQDIGSFKLKSSGTISMSKMFQSASSFNQDINTKSVTIGPNTYAAWNTSQVTNFNSMFQSNSIFNSSISKWNTSSVLNMSYMFYGANKFNQDINTKYYDAASSPTGSAYTAWDMSNVTSIGLMLYGTSRFNQSVDKWQFNTSLTSFSQFMRGCGDFNQPINTQTVTVGPNTYTAWDVQNIQSFSYMFYGCTDFNQPLNNWSTSSATSMVNMFFQCSSFDQSLAAWDISNVSNFGGQFGFLLNLSTSNYDATLVSWNNQNVQTLSSVVDFGDSVPSCDNAASNGAFAARANLMTSNKWNVSILDKFSTSNRCQPLAGFDYTSNAYCTNGSDVTPTITGTVDQTLPLGGTISDAWSAVVAILPLKLTVRIAAGGGSFDVGKVKAGGTSFTVNWGDTTIQNNINTTVPPPPTGNQTVTHTYTGTGSQVDYTVQINDTADSGIITHVRFDDSTTEDKIYDVTQWGTTPWTSFQNFLRNESATIPADVTATDTPNLSNCTAMHGMFQGCTSLVNANNSMVNWITGNVANMNNLLTGTTSFNKNLSGWDITGLSTAVSIFQGGGLDTANYTDTIVGWAVQVYNNSAQPNSVNMSGIPTSGVFDGNRTTDNASGQAYSAKYSNWPGWSNAQAAYDYLTSTLSWTISAS